MSRSTRRGRPRGAVGALAAVSLSSILVVGATGSAQAAPDGNDCTGVNDVKTEKDPATARSAPLQALQISQAQNIVEGLTRSRRAGAGVHVAVVDSGVDDTGITVDVGLGGKALKYYHGTAMAGVIAGQPQKGVGLVGIAPGATIYDARFYDTVDSQDGVTPTEARLVDALRAMLPRVGRREGQISIVTIALTVDKSTTRLEAAIKAVTDKGAIVVASSGNRVPETQPQTEDDDADDDTGYKYGEDVTKYPAGYTTSNDRVVSVGTTDPEGQATPSGLLSSTIDVVTPTYGAVSYAINRSTCSFYAASTSVAAAEVSGILALLRAAFPRDTPEQLIARLEVTATGESASAGGAVDKYRGRGIVQPVEALTRPLRPSLDGRVGPPKQRPPAVAPAVLPQAEPDVLRSTRRNAVWWGLFGGGALVVALLLRPVLSRRRTAPGRR